MLVSLYELAFTHLKPVYLNNHNYNKIDKLSQSSIQMNREYNSSIELCPNNILNSLKTDYPKVSCLSVTVQTVYVVYFIEDYPPIEPNIYSTHHEWNVFVKNGLEAG